MNMPLYKQLVAVNCLTFGAYMMGSGINAQWMQRNFSMSPASWPHTMFTTHFFNYNPVLFAINTAALYKVGQMMGPKFNIVGVMAIGLGSSLFAAAQMYTDHNRSNMSGLGLTAGLCTYAAMTSHFWLFKLAVPLSLMYGIYFNDMSTVGGPITAYVAFLLGLMA